MTRSMKSATTVIATRVPIRLARRVRAQAMRGGVSTNAYLGRLVRAALGEADEECGGDGC